ncbi:hypothetical protein FSARC_9623 [Fusarium sarcochroum]|uniref:Deacetylase sirtuin-type domain-containing protein n=1 Tax=Fusarium sarcochroum TaxID=1208366 RepID=A0A8H4TQX3_9HYPO|nr:hypothetical protein FSARC_9623 [Fusarium sarcochroum]
MPSSSRPPDMVTSSAQCHLPHPKSDHMDCRSSETPDNPLHDYVVGGKHPHDLANSVRPTKKRRTVVTEGRTTEYLDLTKPDEELTSEDYLQINRLHSALHNKKKIVAVVGAGISVSAHVPLFSSPTGLFRNIEEQHNIKGPRTFLFDVSVYKHPETIQAFHAMVRQLAVTTQKAKPTPFHHLLASLAGDNRLLRLYSQNIDCIDTSMEPLATQVPLNPKGPWPATIQLHGSLGKMRCTKCSRLEPLDPEVFEGPEAPLCRSCEDVDHARTTHAGKRSHGIGRLRPHFVLYNEDNPDAEAIGKVSAADLNARPDAVLVVGTALKVHGTRRLVKEMCKATREQKDGLAIWINTQDAPNCAGLKDCWNLVVKSDCDKVAQIVNLPRYDAGVDDDHVSSSQSYRGSP